MRLIGELKIFVLAVLALTAVPAALAEPAGDRALFWSVSSGDQHKGYLLGTIHSEDPRVLGFSEEFLEQLENSRVFAMELVPTLPTLARLAEFMHLSGNSSLQDVIGEKRFESVARALTAYGVPPAQVERMKPWAAMMTLSVPPPETGLFMDFSLSLRASGSGLDVIGLETLEQQLDFLETMPLSLQLDLLDHAVAEFGSVREAHDEMVDVYLGGDLLELNGRVERQLGELNAQTRRWFTERGIADRNHVMFEALLPVLEDGGVFTAVGALHLPGEQGLIALLRGHGYELQPLPPPFTEMP